MLSAVILFGAVPTANASDMNLAAMEEVKKKKKKKQGFFSKVFGSK